MEMVKTAAKHDKYPAYKDSGVEWLREIPEGWEVRRFKTLFNEINERNVDDKGELLSVSQYTGVTKKSDKTEEGELLSRAASLVDYKKVCKNDLVSNIMLAWNGSLGFSPFDGITSPAYSVYRLKEGNNTRYFHYLVRSEIYKSVFKRNSTGVIESRLRLYTDDFYNIFSVLPPFSEQTAIANFLDDKTSKIDTAIAQKEQMIELLKERKQIVIQNAVTGKWTMIDGKWTETPKEKMKDSGVEWIGEIPVGWEVRKVKYCLKSISEKVISKDSEFSYIGMENIESKTGKRIESENESEGLSNKFNEGDILFGKLRPYLAKVFLADIEGICSTEFIVYRTQHPQYFHKLLLSDSFINLVDSSTYGAKMPRANADWIGEQLIPIPQEYEQKEISDYIETQSSKIDQTISLQQSQIEKLKEYKSTLIDSAVTGKIKVS